MWKRSWLSREVLLFTGVFGGRLPLRRRALDAASGGSAIGALTVALGIGGVIASAYIYRVPSRPAWNTPFTLVQFILTAATLGPLFAAAVGTGDSRWLGGRDGDHGRRRSSSFSRCDSSGSARRSRRAAGDGTAARDDARVAPRARAACCSRSGAIALPLFTSHPAALWAAFVLALGGEVLGRYLFFVSAVPKHMAAPYLGSEAA